MTATRLATIRCDGDGHFGDGLTGCGDMVDGDTAADARTVAAANGWQVNVPDADRSYRRRDYCPRHHRDRGSS
jgi:hypothetical protein